jgi:hypothetical protein
MQSLLDNGADPEVIKYLELMSQSEEQQQQPQTAQ